MKRELPIIALDFPNREVVDKFLSNFPDESLNFKVGMELFFSEGGDLIRDLKAKGHSVFLDLKLHDIPTTVERATEQLAGLGVDMLTVHASGGIEMMKSAREGLERASAKNGTNPLLVAVTQLTSTTLSQIRDEQQLVVTMKDSVTHYANMTIEAGLNGVVCSPQEVNSLKNAVGDSLITVAPGIRLNKDNKDDQKRIATPREAALYGADYIVVGRPITQSDDPKAMYDRILSDWQGGLKARNERS